MSNQVGQTNPLETRLLHENFEDLEDDDVKNYRRKYIEALGASPSRPIPSIETPPILEEKPLPTHPRYAYLRDSSTLSVIISSSLSTVEEENLLKVCQAHKGAIGWSLMNIKGIQPSMCMH